MNVAMLTVTAISQGLCLQTQGRSHKRHLLFHLAYCTVSYRCVRREASCKELWLCRKPFEQA